MASDALLEHCIELLAPLGHVRSRRMFGGHGLTIDDLFVALIASERLYLKASASTRADFEAAGCSPFEYERKGRAGRTVALGYWSAPPDAMDSPDAMRPWGRLAIQAALAARSATKPVRPRAARATAAARPVARRR
jgi:DNA transformation protein and related proteins